MTMNSLAQGFVLEDIDEKENIVPSEEFGAVIETSDTRDDVESIETFSTIVKKMIFYKTI